MELDASDNPKITNVSYIRSLIILVAYGDYDIDDAGIANLELENYMLLTI